jgi:hypothetical protein
MHPECSLPFSQDVTVATLSFPIPFYALSYFFKIHFNIITLKSTTSEPLLSLGFPADFLRVSFSVKNFLMNVVHLNVFYILWFVVVVLCINCTYLGHLIFMYPCIVL